MRGRHNFFDMKLTTRTRNAILLLIALLLAISLLVHLCRHTITPPKVEQHILQHVRSTSTAQQQSAAASAVISRLIGPARAAQFLITIDQQLPTNTFQLRRSQRDPLVRITASSGTAACKGFHHYLKHYCQCHVSWDGDQLDRLPATWPEVEHSETAASAIMYYQNVVTWSYSYVWWKWPEWRRHIDWMALNGITLTLAPAQELVWTEVYRELGLTPAEIDQHFAGPAFMAWQRMGNLRGWRGPLSAQFQREQSALQQQVVAAQRELGMAVALPAFAGHVPVAMARLFPNSSMVKACKWLKFDDAECCPLFIDPVDPLFQHVGQLFLRRITKLYGADNHIYFSDPFNEMSPTDGALDFIGHSARSIYAAMQAVDPDAVWLLQGWMFVNLNNFWTAERAEAFLQAVPLGRMLVLDLQSETLPQYERMNYYFGQPWVWCMLHNFGGTMGMHGSVEVLNTRIAAARRHPNSTMLGFGLTMEGIQQNTIVYDFALDRGWDQRTVDASSWFADYATTRYGRKSPKLQAALQKLRTSVYTYNRPKGLYGQYVICSQPNLALNITLPWYQFYEVEDALKLMLEGVANEDGHTNDLLTHDLVDLTRQYLQTRVELLYPTLIVALSSQKADVFENLSALFVEALHEMDVILNTDTRFMLGPVLERAHRWASSDAERQLYDLNVRNQITLWGPNGEILDYAHKQWAGVVADYCLPRWQLFFAEAAEAMRAGGVIDMEQFAKHVRNRVELPFSEAFTTTVPVKPLGDAVQLALAVLKKWSTKRI